MLSSPLVALLWLIPATPPALIGTCSGEAGYVLDVSPGVVPVGTSFTVNLTAPNGSFAILFASPFPGPLVTPVGTLCVGDPFSWVIPISFSMCNMVTFSHTVECDPSAIGIVGHFQFVATTPLDTKVHFSNSDTIQITDGPCNGNIPVGDFVTFTQGAWGQSCAGMNFGCMRDANFATVFGANGLILGDGNGADGDSIFALVFTSSAAVEAFAPAGGPPGALTGDLTDPLTSPAGELAGQLLAAKGNVAFDDAGVFDAMKNDDAIKLGDLKFVACVHPKLVGKTVREVISLGSGMLATAIGSPADVDGDIVGDVNYSDVSDALKAVNENFDKGLVSNGCLGTP